jgi:hypothetical protein
MPSIRTFLVWGLPATLLLVAIAWAGLVSVVFWSARGPHPAMILKAAQPVCDPIVRVLGIYHHKHGRYPDRLGELVDERLLPAIPELPPYRGTSARSGPTYEVNHTLDFYRLSFGYCVAGGTGPGDFHYREYVSDDGRGWVPPSATEIADLVADRILSVYRKEHDAKSLRVFIADVLARADCHFLSRDRIVRWLGPGTEIVVPSGMPGAGRTGYVYRAKDSSGESYCLVFKNQRRTGHDFVDRDYPYLDLLLQVEALDGRPPWTIVRECPRSPADRPVGSAP